MAAAGAQVVGNLARFVTANNSLITAYARGISPTGVPTVSDKDHGREMLSTAKDQASYEAVVNQMMKELAAAQTAPGQVRGELRDAVTGKTGGVDLPLAARQSLQEGHVTTFANGQKWMLKNGQPVQVQDGN